jgi:hypothetical protein
MNMWKRIRGVIVQKPLDVAALLISIAAFGVAWVSFLQEPERQSDQLTSDVIRNAYSDFIEMTDLRTQFPFQSHLFEVVTNYRVVRDQVSFATVDLRNKPNERHRLSLEERAIADRLFTMFEQALYQWRQARERKDSPREQFLREVLEYFTSRLLQNPRLLWYWSPKGGNLSVNYEVATMEYYNTNVRPHSPGDAEGPFTELPVIRTAHAGSKH